MRLKKVETGQRLPKKLMIWAITLMARARVPDVVRTLTYRPELYGNAYNDWIQTTLRGPSGWSVGERELFAAFVSHRNQCPF
jgi:hypothetical protein